jgi:hypothetical protein
MGDFRTDEAGQALVAGSSDRLDLRRSTLGWRLVEGGAADGDHLLGIRGLDGGDGVAGIDWAGERILALHREDVRYLHHVEQGGDARRDILAGGGSRREEDIMMAHQIDDQRGDIFGQRIGISRIVGDMDLANARYARGGLGDSIDALPRHQQMHFAKLRRRGDDCQGRVLELAIFMFDPDERLHASTPVSLILSISSSTEPTLTPAPRFGGSVTLSVVRRGATSTP